jgi:hypothetical protein
MKLDLSPLTWLVFAAAAGLWALSILCTRNPVSPRGWSWRDIPLSFFGLAWLAFGITFIFRFLVLAYDPFFFQATQFPLWKMPAATLTWSWVALTMYWLALVLGYLVMVWWAPPRPLLLEKLDQLGSPDNILTLDILVFCCSCLVILSGLEVIPRAISTPMAILGNFYAIAATTAWLARFQGQPRAIRALLYLIPGVLVYFFSPFRTYIFAVVLCVMIPALKLRRWASLPAFMAAVVALLLVTTIINDYRRAQIKAELTDQPASTLAEEAWGSRQHRTSPSWVRLINRFHGFDSVALTVHFVPSFFPFARLNVFSDLVWRIIPRSIVDKKSELHRGRNFSTTVWAMGDRGLTRRPAANISPTMCADLYQVNAIPLVFIGAAFYGLLMGLLESWQRRGGLLSSCILLALLGVPVALGIEQEFDFAAATVIQITIGLFLFLLFLPVSGPAEHIRRPVVARPPYRK